MKRTATLWIVPLIVSLMAFALWKFGHLVPVATDILFYVMLGVLLTVYVTVILIANERDKKRREEMDNVFNENAGTAAQVIREVNVPCLLVDETGMIVWRNDLMEKLYAADDLAAILPQYRFDRPQAAYPLEIAGGTYQVMSMQVRRKSTDRVLVFQYWIDRTEAAHYQRLFEERMPYVALIYIDNLEELSASREFHRNAVIAEVEHIVSESVADYAGIYREFADGKFIVIFEAKHLEAIKAERFTLLEQAQRIETGTGVPVSLSIAVGEADTILASEESARQAMELALGRGGDQAVVKTGTNYAFYGGKRQLESMQSHVKARLFAKALHQLLDNAGDVIIMGHSMPDMDCVGSALGIATCAKHVGKRFFFVLEESNSSIELAITQIKRSAAYADALISPEQAEKLLRPGSVLVIVDTQRPQTTVAPQLIEKADRIVLIDHHRRSADYLDRTTLHYLESRASSASELITETLQYFDDALRPPAFVCSALLAGITLDTKHFAFNVGSRTFEAAGYLRRFGADISFVKQMFQDEMESYRACARTVENAIILDDGIAMATVGENEEDSKLVAAKAADQLVGIRGIEAAFVLGRENGVLYVSGRSLGRINVQLICEKLGGGGHLTMAGAQLMHHETMEMAMDAVKAAIAEYEQETGGNKE